ncbi:MAG: nucleotidyltransferase domain-containing protein [Bacteroidales bacterium]
MNIGLDTEDIGRIINIIEDNVDIEDAVLFGSRAKGDFTNGSDVDIAFKGNNLQIGDILNLYLAVDELYLPYKFDLIIYDHIEDTALKEHIDRVGVSLKRFITI